MRRVALVLLLIVTACASTQVPAHNGYKKKAQPWKKAKTLKFDEKMEAKAEGDLSYADFRRAAWFVADLPSAGQLDLHLEVTPPGDGVNDDFDLGFEVMDAGYRSIAKADQEDEGAGDLTKSKTLLDLEPGKYYVHLYLQGRLDTADYVLKATFKPMSSVGKSDFPSQVAFVPTLPQVAAQDDTPKSYKPPVATATASVKVHHSKPAAPKEEAKKDEPKKELSGRIIGVSIVQGGTQITIGLGSSAGAAAGMKGKIVGVATGGFTIASCTPRACTATVAATPDQIKGSGSVVLTP